jgi:hypothetical protein
VVTVYLDVDDEITSAAARIRTADEIEIALVLPAGSRIATSRINFRLLAHEATIRSRRLAIVAPEASARALAASAGLPVFATVVEYEDAHGIGSAPPPIAPGMPGGEAPAAPGGRAPLATAAGTAAGAAAVAAAGMAAGPARPGAGPGVRAAPTTRPPATPSSAAPPAPPAPPAARPHGAVGASTGLGGVAPATSRARRRRWPLVIAALLGVAILAGAGAAVGYVVLPTATVDLALAAEPVGPISFVAIADPDATAVDAATATIPATRVGFTVSASGTFPATGKRVETTPATGQVRWTNCDPTRSYTIPRGTLARTPSGIAFATQEAIFLPVAILDPPRIECSDRTVDVRATRQGPAGNVPAGTVTIVPGEYNDVVIKVVNPAAMAGGTREEFPVVEVADVTAAVAELTRQLDAQLAAGAADPAGVPPGATAYPETARRGEPVPSEPVAGIVGREVETFDLALTAEATVVAVDPAPLEDLAAERIAAEVPDGMTLLDGSTVTEIGAGEVAGENVLFPVTTRAEAVRDISEEEVRDLVKGATPAEAEAALAPYGTVEIVLWPDWATTITTVDARLTVTVEGVPPVGPTEPPAATPAAGTGTSPAATAAGTGASRAVGPARAASSSRAP